MPRYLLDTNIWLEHMLGQARSVEVGQLLTSLSTDQLLITDFSLHSIGVILGRLKRQSELTPFVQDLFIDGTVELAVLDPADMVGLVLTMNRFNLDFDDAYQYVAAEKYTVQLVSFDSDFDPTPHGRMTPLDVLATLGS